MPSPHLFFDYKTVAYNACPLTCKPLKDPVLINHFLSISLPLTINSFCAERDIKDWSSPEPCKKQETLVKPGAIPSFSRGEGFSDWPVIFLFSFHLPTLRSLWFQFLFPSCVLVWNVHQLVFLSVIHHFAFKNRFQLFVSRTGSCPEFSVRPWGLSLWKKLTLYLTH